MKSFIKALLAIGLALLVMGCSSSNSLPADSGNAQAASNDEVLSKETKETELEESEKKEEQNEDIVEDDSKVENTEQIDETENDRTVDKSSEQSEERNVNTEDQRKYEWILNTNTKKVHTPNCNSVKEMKEKNKKESNLSPDELREQGYTACEHCKPF